MSATSPTQGIASNFPENEWSLPPSSVGRSWPPIGTPSSQKTSMNTTLITNISNSNCRATASKVSLRPASVGKSPASLPGASRHCTHWPAAPVGILPDFLATSPSSPSNRQMVRGIARRGGWTPSPGGNRASSGKSGTSLVPQPPPPSLALIYSMAGDALLFSETNMDWTKLNIFRTRLCDRLTQTHTCHMANRCLFSHDVNWPRRTPFLPRATALTLRYIPVWCPRLPWPPLVGLCDSSGKVAWTSTDSHWNARLCHQNCTRGDNCPFVHNVEELLYHPEVYKSRSCCLANDDNFEEQISGNNSSALCPWYFCPFAHDLYEARDLRGARYAWHPPPQIVDNQFVARTQGFSDLELLIIDFVRKAPNGSLELYSSSQSPLQLLWRLQMPPVIRPLEGSALEQLAASRGHAACRFDDLLLTMVVSSFINLLLYPVENFYIPTLLSLQCAVVAHQLGLDSETANAIDARALLSRVDSEGSILRGKPSSPISSQRAFQWPQSSHYGSVLTDSSLLGTAAINDEASLIQRSETEPTKSKSFNFQQGTPLCQRPEEIYANSTVSVKPEAGSTEELQAILELLKPEELLQMMQFISSNTPLSGTACTSPPSSTSSSVVTPSQDEDSIVDAQS